MSRILPGLLAAAVLLSAAGATARAQQLPLDDTWFRLSLKAIGNRVDPDSLQVKPGKLSAKAFLHLTLVEAPADGEPLPGFTYAWELWTRQDGGTWAVSDSGQHAFVGAGSGRQLAVDLPLHVQLSDGRHFDARAVLRFDPKVDQQGFLKQAKVRELGGEVLDGSTDGSNLLVGRLDVAGHDVGPGKLPFDP
jgi:hypothetical protein